MKWPKGRHNGQRITGIYLRFMVDILWWSWVPHFGNRYARGFHWLCFHFWFDWQYDERRVQA